MLEGELAYVLHRRPFGEKDLWLELWTREHGKLPVIAHRVPSAARQTELVPFAPLRVWTRGRAEMASLKEWEVSLPRRPLAGTNSLIGLYLNELLYRALPRGEAEPALFDHYSGVLDLLHRRPDTDQAPEADNHASFTAIESGLRRLELGVLAALGYGLQLAQTSSGEPVQPDARYAVDLDSGIRPSVDGPWTGTLLLSLVDLQHSDDTLAKLPMAQRREQRRLLRALLQEMLGERPLASWAMVRGWKAATAVPD
jgi:DNA repair protein RecO (recombination protein O)